METQIPRQHGHNGDEQHPSQGLSPVMQGEVEEHHEKKSVIKNVKDKARSKVKKIKDSLTKHGHGHDHDHDHHSNDEDNDDDNDDDEELVEDTEVHGSPMYESAAVKSGIGAGQQLDVEKPTEMAEDRYNNPITGTPTRPFSEAEHAKPEHEQFRNIEHGMDENKGNPKGRIGIPTEMEEDPHAHNDKQEPSNYRSKVDDPTGAGGAEAGVTPILRSFDKMSVHDEPHPESNPENPPKMFTGSHDQFSFEPIPENAPADTKDPGSALKSFNSGEKQSVPIPENTPVDPKDPGSALKPLLSNESQSSYTEKISSATSAITGKAVAAKNAVASKLGYGEKEGSGKSGYAEKEGSGKSGYGEKEGSGKSGYGEKEGSGISNRGEEEKSSGGVTATVADYAQRAAATVTGTVAGVGSSVMSKVQGGPTVDNKGMSKETVETVENKGTSKGMTGYFAEKLRPSEDDKALSGVISDTLSRKKPESEDKPMGKVTVSDEVARHLGTKEEVPKGEKEGIDAGVVENVHPDVVERVKGWFGIGQSPSSQASQGYTNADNEQSLSSVDSGGERRLQESAN